MSLWQWLEPGLFWLAVANLLTAAVCTFLIGLAGYRTKKLAQQPFPDLPRWPSVSLVSAARNEERNIEQAVRSLLQLDYPDLEITLVNDRSTDRTGEILDRLAAEFPQLNVVHLSELPAGWLGKNHALQLGADRSRGEFLLFTDADIFFEPTALRRAIGYALAARVDHLAALPDMHMPQWLLTAFIITFSIYFTLYCRMWAIRNPRSRAHTGVGAFNLVRAEVYRALGGHQTIRMRPDDDLKLGKIIKLAGYRQDVISGQGMIAVEWYQSIGELVRGLEKNFFSGVDYRVGLTLFSAGLSILFNIWPYLAVLIVPGPTRWVYLAVCLTLWLMAGMMAYGMKAPLSCALAMPLAVAMFVYIQLRTMLLNFRQNGIRWRDTHYSLAELRANKV